MTNVSSWDEAKLCGAVPEAGDADYQGPNSRPCDGVGHPMRTGSKAKFGLRYLECPKCGRTWQVTFKRSQPLARSDATVK
jgi:hypothetical protein